MINHKGQTALMLAAGAGMKSLVLSLLRCHVSEMTADCEGRTALQYALEAKENQRAIVSALLGLKDGKGKGNVELVAITYANGEVVDRLVEKSDPWVREKILELKKQVEGKTMDVFLEEDDLWSVCGKQRKRKPRRRLRGDARDRLGWTRLGGGGCARRARGRVDAESRRKALRCERRTSRARSTVDELCPNER